MNQENYGAKAVLNEDVRPDFGRIMDALKSESSLSVELSNRLVSVVHSVKNMQELNEPNDIKEKEPSCLVDYLWIEIWRLQRSNKLFERALSHLQKTVGS